MFLLANILLHRVALHYVVWRGNSFYFWFIAAASLFPLFLGAMLTLFRPNQHYAQEESVHSVHFIASYQSDWQFCLII